MFSEVWNEDFSIRLDKNFGKRSRNLITGEGTSRSGAIKNHCETAGTNVGGLPPNKWADTLSCK
ncbi:MAG: hypothetical protein ACRC10_10745, partial [Thermoguttaceae bacterium]